MCRRKRVRAWPSVAGGMEIEKWRACDCSRPHLHHSAAAATQRYRGATAILRLVYSTAPAARGGDRLQVASSQLQSRSASNARGAIVCTPGGCAHGPSHFTSATALGPCIPSGTNPRHPASATALPWSFVLFSSRILPVVHGAAGSLLCRTPLPYSDPRALDCRVTSRYTFAARSPLLFHSKSSLLRLVSLYCH